MRRPAAELFHRIVFMGGGIVPGYRDRAAWVVLHQGGKHLCELLAALLPLELHERLSGVVIHGTDAVLLIRLSGGEDQHLLAFGAPHRVQRGEPAQVELIGILEGVSCLQSVASLFNRLFCTR